MNQKMKKLLALLLALVMVFALAACGNDAGNYEDEDEDDDKTSQTDDKTSQTDDEAGNEEDDKQEELTDEDLVIGQWAVSANIGDLMNAGIAQSLGSEDLSSDEEMLLVMSMEFGEDGAYSFSFTTDDSSVSRYMSDLKQKMIDYMYQMAEKQEMDKETFDEMVQSQYEMPLDEYVDSVLSTAVEALLETFDNSSISGYYKLDSENGLIYIAPSESALEAETDYLEYAFDGNILSISDMVSDGDSVTESIEELGFALPWEMERQ